MCIRDSLLTQDVDHLLVADNGSVDGTLELVEAMSLRDSRIHVAYDREPAYYQGEKMSLLVRAASRAGADWVVPFDADEFWFAGGESVGSYLRGLSRQDRNAGIVSAAFHHMIPVSDPPHDWSTTEFIMDSTPAVPGKVAVRGHPLAGVHVGNHFGMRVGSRHSGLYIAHAMFRSPEQAVSYTHLDVYKRQGCLRRVDSRGGAAKPRLGIAPTGLAAPCPLDRRGDRCLDADPGGGASTPRSGYCRGTVVTFPGVGSRAKLEAGQVAWFLREHRSQSVRRKAWAAYRGVELPKLPRSRRRPGEVWGVTMVRDEADILEATLTHLLTQDVDHLLVADNGSVSYTHLDVYKRQGPLCPAADCLLRSVFI